MNISPQSAEVPFFLSNATFDVVVQQWAKARMEIPMQIIGRFDDAAKQLIAIGSTLQGLYLAVFTISGMKGQMSVILLGLMSAPLVLLIACAAQAICTVPLKKEAYGTYILFKERPGISDERLTGAIDAWCQSVDAIADEKHKWLQRAKIMLIINSAASLAVLVAAMRHHP